MAVDRELHAGLAFSAMASPSRPAFLSSKVQVLYGGTDLFDYEVRKTFNNDMLLAFVSSSCIAVLVYILASCSGKGVAISRP